MKKKIAVILMLIMLIIGGVVGWIGLTGYHTYKEVTEATPYAQKVAELQSKSSYVTLAEISPAYVSAVLKSEDRRFYQHGAIDFYSIIRAVFINISSMSYEEGGSTITQQLAKNLYLTQQKKMSRKVAEAFIANDLERLYSKDQILEMYLNITYFGNNCYGIKEASYYYYNKSPSELNAAEIKALVRTIKSPNNRNPKVVLAN